ncbi:hypothetical protein GYMLUDRAFT_255986 [Collybiopsis luxurians FD-317 M1]|nr:hypothetical protein GYMLUDRAFT_255986 [Collybiopsis luxurians FD-317 M1]
MSFVFTITPGSSAGSQRTSVEANVVTISRRQDFTFRPGSGGFGPGWSGWNGFPTGEPTSGTGKTEVPSSSQAQVVTSTSDRSTTAVGRSTTGATTPSLAPSSSRSTTSSVQSQTSTESTPSSSAVIVGSTVAAVFTALLVSGIFIFLCLRRRRRQTQASEECNKITPLDPTDRRTAPLTEKGFFTPGLFKLSLNTSPLVPGQQNGTVRHQHPIDGRSSDVDAQSRVTSLQDSNEEMRATMNRVMEYVYRLEARIESEGVREGRMSDVPEAPPPSYLSLPV